VLPRGTAFLAHAGYSNSEKLAGVRSVDAEACGVTDRKGAIQAGKDADFVVVGGDPTVDVAACST
jgi:imidazolonepropionase-like amidohydrolase